jgi:glucose/mannose-6-phosphate isomerase
MTKSPTATATANDPQNMLGRILSFPQQMRDARALALSGPLLLKQSSCSRIFVAGMGGSAIGGDFLRQVAWDKSTALVETLRGYRLPRAAFTESFLAFVSYSGNTEETLALWSEASRAGIPRCAITSGGQLRSAAHAENVACLEIPSGSPPRAALAWTCIPLIVALERANLSRLDSGEWEEAIGVCEQIVQRFGPGGEKHPLLQEWARGTQGRIAFIYAAEDPTAAVARRWVSQINENAKSLAHAALFPEHNHNEIVGWESDSLADKVSVAFLDDPTAHPQVRRRLDLAAQGLSDRVPSFRFEALGRTTLARLFSLSLLGDLASVTLAAVLGVDPTPVVSIDRLKSALSSGKIDGSSLEKLP